MQDYLCQMFDYDAEDEWTVVKALDAEDAASAYAELCDNRSGGELFMDASRDRHTVLVKQDGEPIRVDVSFDYSKDFYAHTA